VTDHAGTRAKYVGPSFSSGDRPRPSRVQLMVTCLVDSLAPDVGFAVVRVLERVGIQVEVPPGQTCCGQPAFNAGCWGDARAMAKHTIDAFGDSEVPVVVPSGSCGDMVIHQAANLLADDPEYAGRAKTLADRTYELTAFLVDVLGITDIGARFDGRLTYHPACHGLRGLGLSTQPRALVEGLRGAEVCPLPEAETCCGFGGLFALKMADISSSLLARKIANIEASGAETVVATDISCLLHIGGGLRRKGSSVQVKHLVELLAETE
jgi:L-lactate dehydrogenase complex protein LldE